MNLIALFGAIIGLVLLATTVIYGNNIRNQILRYLAAGVGLVISIFVAAYATEALTAFFGDKNTDTVGKAGEYMMYLAIAFFIVRLIFFRKSKTASPK